METKILDNMEKSEAMYTFVTKTEFVEYKEEYNGYIEKISNFLHSQNEYNDEIHNSITDAKRKLSITNCVAITSLIGNIVLLATLILHYL